MCDKLINKPQVCDKYQQIDLIDTSQQQKMNAKNQILMALSLLFIGMIILLLIILIIKRTLKTKIDNEVSFEVQRHVSEYMRIKDVAQD